MTRPVLYVYLAVVSLWLVEVPTAVRVPVEWVLTMGGEQTEMMTGLLYALHHVELDGAVTYLKSDNVTSNIGETRDNILVVRNLKHSSGREYLPGGRFEKSTFFAFQKHSEHYYTLIHIELRDSVTYKPYHLMPTNRVGFQDDTLVVNDFDRFDTTGYQREGRNEENFTLFGISKYQDGYKLFHKELNAPVTYEPEENSVRNVDGSQDNWLVVRSDRSPLSNNYKQGGVWERSTEFQFPQVRFHLQATISNFTYDNIALLHELATDNPGVSTSMLNYTNERFDTGTTYPVNETKQLINSVTFTFHDSLQMRYLHQKIDAVVSASLQFIPGIRSNDKIVKWNTRDTSLKSERVITTDVTEVRVFATLEVLPRERVEIRALWIPIDVQVPFEASATVTAVADHLNDDRTVEPSLPVGANTVAALLRAQGLGGEYRRPNGETTLTLSGSVRVRRAVDPFATVVYHKIS